MTRKVRTSTHAIEDILTTGSDRWSPLVGARVLLTNGTFGTITHEDKQVVGDDLVFSLVTVLTDAGNTFTEWV